MKNDYEKDGKTLTIFHEEERFITEVYLNGEYEKVLKLVGKDNGEDLIVMDIGCNIGTFSFSIYDRAKKIYAIDLSKGCIDLLKQTIDYNKLDKIIPIQMALSSENGVRQVTSITQTNGANMFGAGVEVPTMTLYTLFETYNIDYVDVLKIDVEGGEYDIFSAKDFEKLKGRIKSIIGEHGGRTKDLLKNIGLNHTQIGGHFYAL
jgi:FkbM family methyltransferase